MKTLQTRIEKRIKNIGSGNDYIRKYFPKTFVRKKKIKDSTAPAVLYIRGIRQNSTLREG